MQIATSGVVGERISESKVGVGLSVNWFNNFGVGINGISLH